MLYCKDCRFFRRDTFFRLIPFIPSNAEIMFGKCAHEQAAIRTGTSFYEPTGAVPPAPGMDAAAKMRRDYGKCGPEARLFEPLPR